MGILSVVTQVIVPDVHEKIKKLKRIEERYKGIPIIYLSDFLDSFDGLTENTHETIDWLYHNLEDPSKTFIWGNHDIHYAYPVDAHICSGWSKAKCKLATRLKFLWNNFKLHHWISVAGKEILISHAGLHPTHLHPVKGFDKDYLLEMEEEAMWKLKYSQLVTPFIAVGKDCGGDAKFGGIDWLRWHNLVPIDGLDQIVGHTCEFDVRFKITENSYNMCLDTDLNHLVEIIDNHSIRILDISSL